jgi:PAS domain S-box-containing protein
MAAASEYELESIRASAEFTLYRARQLGTDMPLLVVAPAAEQPLLQSLRRLEHEYSLAAELEPAWATKPLALTRHEGRTILVLADPGGEPLDRVLDRDGQEALDVPRFLALAIGMATALGHVHQHGLIHKDFKPENVIVDDAGHVWLTGFGIASRLPRERQSPAAPETVAGTLAYMSPEQTGRMNRSMDTRSDLYSLGVTLYQMLTGVLPFAAADPLEWVHCHIARQPITPAERREVPEPLSAIIMRLLAKNAEDRYQTSTGLVADLRRCLAQWRTHGRIDSFQLGADDLSDRLLIPEKLYGREREVNALLTAFDQVVAQGTAELVLVSGYSGVGKSSVVNELHKALVPPRGLFAAGKFDQYKRDVPYATLAQAFQTLVRQILVKSEAEVDHWRDTLREALGPNGQLMVDLIPEVEFVIGKQPPVAELPPQEARGRFQLVFRRFLGAFARPDHPLALFLDDLQWLDTATLELLERLITDPDVRHVLLIGAYRDNEVSPSHPLMRTLGAIREAGAKTLEIVLAPLGLDDVERLTADALHCGPNSDCGPNSAGPLALLVYEKTGGNPFFAIQFLTALAEESLLGFDRDASGWTWDVDRIRARGYSGNVVDLMVGKLQRLSDTTQVALRQLACLGNVAEITTLSMVFGQSEEGIHAGFRDAARNGLIFRMEGYYSFPHDRIQEAAYALIPESERAGEHLRIGRLLLSSLTDEGPIELLFDIASQLNRGAALLTDHDEKVRVAGISLRAGRKAKASAAYASAREYFAAGMALLHEIDWSNEYELTFSLWLERAECELLTGDFEMAGQLIGGLMQRAASKVDEASVGHLKVTFHVMRSEFQPAVEAALTCLDRLGIEIPAHPTEDQVQAEIETLGQALGARSIESLIDLPLMIDPELVAATQMLSDLTVPAYFADQRLFCLLPFRTVKISLQHGISSDSAYAISNLGFMLGFERFRRYRDGYRFAKLACDLVEKHGFIAIRAKVYVASGVVAAWTRPIATAIDFGQAGFRAAIDTGDLTYACLSAYETILHLLVRNDPLDVVWRESETELDFVQKARYRDAADIIVIQQRFIAAMQGRTATFSTFSDAQYDEAAFEARFAGGRNLMTICWYWIVKLKARFLSGDYAEAQAAADRAKPLLGATAGLIVQLDYFYFAALTVAALYETASADEQQAWRKLLREHQEQLREWAEINPSTFADKHALVLAEIARIEKRDSDALRLYEQAIHLARENGFVQNEGLAHELAAQYYLAHGIETAGYAYLRNARNCCHLWGAHGKVKQLEDRYPHLREERTSASSATIGPSVEQLDVETVVNASQAISSEMALPALIEKLVRIAAVNAGAERGLLILIRDGELRIEAEAITGPGGIDVVVRPAAVTPSDLPQYALHYVIRTQESLLLDDASADNVYSKDEYVRRKHSRSVLCLPIVKQAKLLGALYLENNLTAGAFTPDRVTVLRLLASQAAISIENATLYSDLELQAGLLQNLPVSAWTLKPDGTPDFVNRVWLDYSGQTLDFVRSRPDAWMTAIHAEDREAASKAFWNGINRGQGFAFETRFLRAEDGTWRWHLNQAVVLRDAEGKVVKFVGTTTDIDDRKRVEEKLRESEYEARLIVNSIPGLVCTLNPAGQIDLANRRLLDFFGMNLEELNSWGTNGAVHPDDLPRVIAELTHSLTTGTVYDSELRYRRADGLYRWSQTRILPVRDTEGGIARWYGLITDIDDRKRAEEKLRESEYEARLIVDSIPGMIAVLGPSGEIERVSQPLLDYFQRSLEECRQWAVDDSIHPDDRPGYLQAFGRAFAAGDPVEYEVRVRRFDGVYRWFNVRGLPLRDRQGHIVRWYFLLTDIDDKKRAEEALRESEHESRLIVDSIPGMIAVLGTNGELERVSQPVLDFFGKSQEELRQWAVDDTIHPDDRLAYLQTFARCFAAGDPFEYEAVRNRRFDGVYRWLDMRGLPLRDRQGHIVRWYFLITEIDDKKRAEDKIRQSEKEARQLLDLSPLHIGELGPDGAHLYVNRASLDYYGITLEEWKDAGVEQVLHPQDAAMVTRDLPLKLQTGLPFEYEARLRRKDGQYRWFHYRLSPVSDEEGRITRWYAAGTDIDDRKLAEQRLQEENVALREEIDKTSMFEEIVGTSAPLKKMLSRISRVAPTDSSVLITGETGTGKELVARAIHRRSRRSSYPFVSLNCAAIPRDLIASELFGHELGAFTGATQRRLGRFELATGGTLFLDEVGELPAETQVTLLRVLQEHEFERIGGAGSIRVDVRVIAATNRDLEEAIRAGTFRSDLFYRLNVFPIEVPTLRERKEDIPLLLRYFLDRYGMKAGKSFKTVDKRSLDLLQSYPWPGNIRELQNVIERSVIVSDTGAFSVDESWLSRRPPTTGLEIRRDPFRTPPAEEKATIEAALRECGGRIYGPAGAAEKLGIPRSTLESKIRTLKINKNRFRGPLPD